MGHICAALRISTNISVIGKLMTVLDYHHCLEAKNCHKSLAWKKLVDCYPVLRIEQGKGRKDRYTVLSERLLCELREYWQKYSPGKWFFPGQKPNSHITATSVSIALYRAKKKAQITKTCSLHTLRLLRIFYTTATTSIPSANFLVTPQ